MGVHRLATETKEGTNATVIAAPRSRTAIAETCRVSTFKDNAVLSRSSCCCQFVDRSRSNSRVVQICQIICSSICTLFAV